MKAEHLTAVSKETDAAAQGAIKLFKNRVIPSCKAHTQLVYSHIDLAAAVWAHKKLRDGRSLVRLDRKSLLVFPASTYNREIMN